MASSNEDSPKSIGSGSDPLLNSTIVESTETMEVVEVVRERSDSNASLSSIGSSRTQASGSSDGRSRKSKRKKADGNDDDDGIDPVKSAIDQCYGAEEELKNYVREAQENKKNFNTKTIDNIVDMLAEMNKSFTILACEASKARTAGVFLEKQCAKLEKDTHQQQKRRQQQQPVTPQTPSVGVVYAATLRAPPPKRPNGQRNKVPEKRFTVFVKPADTTEAGPSAPAETKKAFMAAFDPRSSKLRVKSVRTTRDGLAVDVASQAGLDKIASSNNLTDKCLTASIAELRKPKVIVYDVDKDISNMDSVDMLYEQNEELSPGMQKNDLANGVTVRFKGRPGQNKETVNWVIGVAPAIRNVLITAGRVYLGYSSCRVNDHISVPTCYKCQAYGHVSKHCKA
ncbi:hypothetical protein QAD02_010484 [Eretmocerus hayati]|uniref:Uncharacterized protein n=1 Tax=Eretmocerus hayati TaxID=131215 RepID=A0ACC2NV01_9HYME|nr:hypothetical protein QAD02_010484 [Eretmocerus hayati]